MCHKTILTYFINSKDKIIKLKNQEHETKQVNFEKFED